MGRDRIAARMRGSLCVLVVGALLAGCTGSAEPVESTGSPGASASASSPASPAASPSRTLSATEQQAFEEATAVVLAYRQTIADLYSGARTDLNDLDKVATGGKLDRELNNVSQGLAQGYRSEPVGASLILVSADPVSVDLTGAEPTVVTRVCIDATGVTDVAPDGERSRGLREELVYTVVRTSYLPDPGWAVADTAGARTAEDRGC